MVTATTTAVDRPATSFLSMFDAALCQEPAHTPLRLPEHAKLHAEPGDSAYEQQDAATTAQAIQIVNDLIKREADEISAEPDDADDLYTLLQIRQMLIDFQLGETSEALIQAGDPGVSDVHVPTLIGSARRSKLKKYATQLKEMLAKVKGSRSAFEPMSFSAEGLNGESVRAISFMEPPEWIPYLPIPHVSHHPEYGEMVVTTERNANFIRNFKAGVYQTELPIDGEHELKMGGAFGHITDMRQNADGSGDAKVRWSDRGSISLKGDRFIAVSPEWFDEWTDKVTGVTYKDVAIGGALVNRAFFKHGTLRPLRSLAASEHMIGAVMHRAKVQEAPAVKFGYTTSEHPAFDGTHTHPHEGAATGGNADDVDAADDAAHSHDHTHAGDSLHAHDHAGVTFKEKTMPDVQPPTTPNPSLVFAEELRQLREENSRLKTASEATAAASLAMAEQLKSMAEASQLKRFSDEIMGRGDSSGIRWWLGPTTAPGSSGVDALTKQVGTLKTLAAAFGEESDQFRDYVNQQRSLAEAVRHSDVFTSQGMPGHGEMVGAESRVNALARQMTEKDPTITNEKAIIAVMNRNPQLYKEFEEERERRIKQS